MASVKALVACIYQVSAGAALLVYQQLTAAPAALLVYQQLAAAPAAWPPSSGWAAAFWPLSQRHKRRLPLLRYRRCCTSNAGEAAAVRRRRRSGARALAAALRCGGARLALRRLGAYNCCTILVRSYM